MKKVVTFTLTFMMTLFFVVPISANADVTINVTKPHDWKGLAVQAWNDELGDITTWPGVKLIQNGDKYTYTIKVDSSQNIILRLNDDGEGRQTSQIDGLCDSEGKGKGLAQGCYDIIIGEKTNKKVNEYTWTLTKSKEIKNIKKYNLEINNKSQIKTPSTSDSMNVTLCGIIVVISSVIAISLYKKRME